ncbi:lipopolysaccharide biosynthesis protein [Xanthobacter sp. DSM 24535]|uniref:exopolysaccharide transport family protein n=1 Tax=Roseixanthobacter psychrophilus TaxID=3119917 RepID=UPI00372A606B
MTVTHAAEVEGTAPISWSDVRAPAFTVRDFLIATAYHIRIVLIAALLPLLVGLAASLSAKTEYTASSLLMVLVNREVNSQNVTDSGPTTLSIEGLKTVESEVQILESSDVIRDTIEAIGVDRLFPRGRLGSLLAYLRFGKPAEGPLDKAIEQFRKNMRASVQSGSNIILVTYTSPDRALSIEATDTVVKFYMQRRRSIFDNPTAAILTVEVERFKRDLRSVDLEIQALKTKSDIIDFTQDALLAANQVDSLIQRRRQVAERRVSVVAQLSEAERQLKGQSETVFDFNQKSDVTPNDEDRNVLTGLLVERDRLVQQYAPGSPLIKEADRKIATVRRAMAEAELRMFSTNREVRNPSIAYLNNMILSLRVEADALQLQITELDAQQATAEKRLAVLRSTETRLVELTRQRDSLNEGYREYLRRAVAASIEETATKVRASNVRVVQDASSAVTSRSMAIPLLAGGIFGGLLFGAAAGALASAVRTVFIQPGESERALHLPALAEFSDKRDALNSDQDISALATLLLDTELDGKPLRTLHFVTQERDDDVPLLSRRLAEEFSMQRGLRTLLVDLCSATPHPLEPAQTEVQGGLIVTPTSVPLLWSVTDDTESPLLSVRLPLVDARQMMEELEETFDAIVFCSIAQMSSPVIQRLNLLVDANILVIRAESTRKAAALRLRSTVLENGGFILGLVFLGRRYYLPEWIYKRA